MTTPDIPAEAQGGSEAVVDDGTFMLDHRGQVVDPSADAPPTPGDADE